MLSGEENKEEISQEGEDNFSFFRKKTKKKWVDCGLCYGRGQFTEYDETWKCPSCNGLGGGFLKL